MCLLLEEHSEQNQQAKFHSELVTEDCKRANDSNDLKRRVKNKSCGKFRLTTQIQ